jgi:hypothetical protein
VRNAILLITAALLLSTAFLSSACAGGAAAGLSDAGTLATDQAPVSLYADSPAAAGSEASPASATTTAGPASHPDEAADLGQVRLLGVALAADNAYVMVQFQAPPGLARTWQQGDVSVTDEASHAVYDQIPLVPLLGALFGKPVEDGQTGYVMFWNLPPLAKGAQVTVALGGFRQEHVKVD